MIDLPYQTSISTKLKHDFFILTQLNLPVMITDREGFVLWMNKEFESLCGYNLSELKGKKPGKYLQGPFTNWEVKDSISKAIKQKIAIEADILNYKKDETPYWVSLNISPMIDENGTLNCFVCIARDITEQRELERESVRIMAKAAKMMIPEGWIKKCAWTGKASM